LDIVGSVIAGSHGQILIREKAQAEIELGDLLRVDHKDSSYSILQVYDLAYGSQIPGRQLEMISGMRLEGFSGDLNFMDPSLRNYMMASVKSVLTIKNGIPKIPKKLPPFFSNIHRVIGEDLKFLTKPVNPIYLGDVRSGSKTLGLNIFLNGEDMFKHHVLIPATTGRGKSNLVKVILWSAVENKNFGVLVLDPHDEYYGRHTIGLKDHPQAKNNVLYYSPTAPQGANTLLINLSSVIPSHLTEFIPFTDAQKDALIRYYNEFGERWIENIVLGTERDDIQPVTLNVLQRKFNNILGVYKDNDGEIACRSRIFSESVGDSTIHDIARALEAGKIVVVDTSRLLNQAELLIGSMITGNIFWRYMNYKSEGSLESKPVVSIVIEEAPRVLGAQTLAAGDNIYSTIAREGRKFKVGLVAVTQLTSLIPREILANLNTKIILGNEMSAERSAIIDSACQDLSRDDRTISSLDRGEAIISSTFTKFAVPIQIPKFEDYVRSSTTKTHTPSDERIIFR
jgi:DNA helicase HerA-like ATPase